MELMYLDENLNESGIIKDFSLDLAFGRDENNFEIKTSENEMLPNYFWIIEGTEFGGIVDEVSKLSDEENVIYRGRSLQGILASFYCYQLPFETSGENIIVEGYPTEILSRTIAALYLPFKVLGANETEQLISLTIPRNTNVYEFLLLIDGYKILFGYDKQITIRITGSVDYTQDEYFDSSQFALRVSANSNIPNHIIGVYKKDDKEIVKNLYIEADGSVQPYYQLDSMHNGQKPFHDAEYERVDGHPIFTGIEEKILLVEGGSTIENYDLVTELTDSDGNTPFENGVPFDWNTNFMNYYNALWDEDTGEISYVKIEARPDYKPITIPNAQWWERHWGAYYKRELIDGEYVYTQLSSADVVSTPTYRKVANAGNLPSDWEQNWSKYYQFVSQDNYQLFEGRDNIKYKEQKDKGTMWDTDRGSFYIFWKKYIYDIKAEKERNGKMVVVSQIQIKDSLKNGTPDGVHTFAWYKKRKGNVFKTQDGTKWTISKRKNPYWQDWTSLTDYCNQTGKKLMGKDGIQWGEFKVYLPYELPKLPPLTDVDIYEKVETTAAPPMDATYYEQDGYVVPPFYQGQIYRLIEDNYTNLIELMMEALNQKIQESIKIEPKIDLNTIEFDVNDIIGGTHPFLDQQIQSKISKKIIRGNSNGLTASYEV